MIGSTPPDWARKTAAAPGPIFAAASLVMVAALLAAATKFDSTVQPLSCRCAEEVGLGSYDTYRYVCGQYVAGVSSAGVPSVERKHTVKFILI